MSLIPDDLPTAVEIAEAVRRGERSARDVLEQHLALPQARLVGVEGAKHLWVGEKYAGRVLNEIVDEVIPGGTGGTALPQALSQVFTAYEVTPQGRGAIQDIAYRTMRQLGRSQTLLGLTTSKAPEPPMLDALLCAALACAAT